MSGAVAAKEKGRTIMVKAIENYAAAVKATNSAILALSHATHEFSDFAGDLAPLRNKRAEAIEAELVAASAMNAAVGTTIPTDRLYR